MMEIDYNYEEEEESGEQNRAEILDKIDYLKSVHLNSWEIDFIDSLENIVCDEEEGFLTPKQLEKLEEVYEKHA